MTEALSFFLDEVIAPFFTEFLPEFFKEIVATFNEIIAGFSTAPFEAIFALVVTSFLLLILLIMIYYLVVDIPLRLLRGLLWIAGNNIGRAKKYTDSEVKKIEAKISEQRREIVKYFFQTTMGLESITPKDKTRNAIQLLKSTTSNKTRSGRQLLEILSRQTLEEPYQLGSMPLIEYRELLHSNNRASRLYYDLKAEEDYGKRYHLYDINFSKENLENISASKFVFEYCNFDKARISGSMIGANFHHASFEGAETCVDFSITDLRYANFKNVTVWSPSFGASFTGARLQRANFKGAFLNYDVVDRRITELKEEKSKKGEDLNESEIHEEAVQHTLEHFRRSNIGFVPFIKAHVGNTDFANSHLIGANFYQSHGEEPCFGQSIIIRSLFAKVEFLQPSFQNANIESCCFSQATLKKADFSNSFCLESAFDDYIPDKNNNQWQVERIDKPISQWRRFRNFIGFSRNRERVLHESDDKVFWVYPYYDEFTDLLIMKRTQIINLFTPQTIITYANFNDSVFERCRFKYVNLEGSTFHNAKMEKCSFWFCNFRGCDLTNAKFIDCKGLSVRQLSKAKTLKDAQLPDKLRLPLQKRFPHLFV